MYFMNLAAEEGREGQRTSLALFLNLFAMTYQSELNTFYFLMNELSPQKQYHQLRKRIYQKITESVLDEQQLIIDQSQLLEEVRERLDRRKAYESLNNFSLNITNVSSIQNVSTSDDSFRNRFTEEVENSILNSAVKEIKANCSQQTFDTVMGYLLNNKIKQYDDLKKEYEKKIREYEELAVLIIMYLWNRRSKQKDIGFLERDLSSLRTKEEFLEQQRKKVRRKGDTLDEKQKRLHSAEMSLIFKEKLNQEGKRRYERQRELNESILERMAKISGEMDLLWQRIISTMSKADCACEGNCWKQEIMKKCKEQLFEQRKILQQQQAQIQKEYQTMRNLSEQIKKVFISVQHQNEKGETPLKRSQVEKEKK